MDRPLYWAEGELNGEFFGVAVMEMPMPVPGLLILEQLLLEVNSITRQLERHNGLALGSTVPSSAAMAVLVGK